MQVIAENNLKPLMIGNVNKKHLVLMGPPGAGNILGMKVFDIDDDLLEVVWQMPVSQKLALEGEEGFIKAEGKACENLRMENENPTIISLSGSVPLYQPAIENIRRQGVVIYLDVPSTIIEHRLHEMKVDRIVGMKPGQTLADLLEYRKTFYEQYYDVRVTCSTMNGCAESVDQVVSRIIQAFNFYRNENGEQEYTSTRGEGKLQNTGKSLCEVITRGLATDGGLYVPKTFPTFTLNELHVMKDFTNYEQVAVRVLEKFPMSGITPQELKQLVHEAYGSGNSKFHSAEIVELTRLPKSVIHQDTSVMSNACREYSNQFLVELFHGPTASFKDLALQLVPKLFTQAKKHLHEEFSQPVLTSHKVSHPSILHSHHHEQPITNKTESTEKTIILTATSGDTGSSAIEGYKHEKNISIIVLYPKGGVSPLQELQMLQTHHANNVRVFGVNGDFDKCQRMVKEIFSNFQFQHQLKEKHGATLTSANSMNWARIMPQIVYHVYSYLQLVKRGMIQLGDEIDMVVPSGNFGNLLSAVYACKMGLIFVRKFICASNENCVLTQFFNTGVYDLRGRELQKTTSPSIDILKSSNIERLLYNMLSFENDRSTTLVSRYMNQLESEHYFQVSSEIFELLKEKFVAAFATQKQVAETIAETWKQSGILLDTHTAVAKYVGDLFNHKLSNDNCQQIPMLIVSTAHWSKFPNAVLEALTPEGTRKVYSQHNDNKVDNLKELFYEIERKAMGSTIHPSIQSVLFVGSSNVTPSMQHELCQHTEDVLEHIYKLVLQD
ncbi:hypothetical protein C9374_000415 [Naegleria lovaniensis]|uniref:Threonine synthase n=1 Tax=Naegleria lovaniensis TaxID=51637 RepID=A0AA88GYC0_NAELO|nr:uncharacterized protein C9374_000415 [Naegleria lovaniensis]KAG2388251.1 hypothetical protein C9374_000415 [Naegleria lovaniensis]